MDELLAALDRCRNTSPGPDGIHNQMLSHLPPAGREFLLSMYNRMWTESSVQTARREATVIPILEPGGDRSLPTSYRPISLTSCLCKIMEHMVNRHHVWILESRNLLSNAQYGFRRHRSTTDHLANLEYHVQNSFLLLQHLVAVFFDLEKAYDTIWRYGILRTLHRWNLRGPGSLFPCPPRQCFIWALPTRKWSATRTHTKCYTVRNRHQWYGIRSWAICGDIAVCRRRCHFLQFPKHRHHRTPVTGSYKPLSHWALENGFSFYVVKTQCVHFTRLRGLHPHPSLFLNNSALPFVPSVTFWAFYWQQAFMGTSFEMAPL
jgi:hypothetical protein